MSLLAYQLKIEGRGDAHFLFVYEVLWMKSMKTIDVIGIVIV